MESMKYSLAQLKFAEELAFPEDMLRLFQAHCPDCWGSFYIKWLRECDRSLIRFIFSYSRADFKNGLGAQFEAIINDLIKGYEA